MKYGRYGASHLLMRTGLGIVFVWIGIDILRNPTNWIGYVPEQLSLDLTRELALQISGIADAVIGILLIVQVFPKLTALVAAAHLAGILVTQGINAVIVRDIGLLGTALALLFWPGHYRKRRWFKRSSSAGSDE